MARRVRVWPPFYARLAIECTVEQELEIVGRRLTDVERAFAVSWDECSLVPGRGPEWRFLTVVLAGGVLAAIYARQSPTDSEVIEIRNITVMGIAGR